MLGRWFVYLLQSSVVVRLQPAWSFRLKIKGGCCITRTSLSWSWTGSMWSSRRTIPGEGCSGARSEAGISWYCDIDHLLISLLPSFHQDWPGKVSFIFTLKRLLEKETRIFVGIVQSLTNKMNSMKPSPTSVHFCDHVFRTVTVIIIGSQVQMSWFTISPTSTSTSGSGCDDHEL